MATTQNGAIPVSDNMRYAALKHVSWPAIFAGIAVALTVQILLSMLGTGIGMSTIDPLQGDTPSLKAFSLGAGLWWVVSFFFSLAAGGIVAGELAGYTTRTDGALHGLITWASATLIGVYLVGNIVSGALSGAGHLASSAVNGAAMGAVAAAPQAGDNNMDNNPNINWSKVEQEARALLANAANTPDQASTSDTAPANSEVADAYGSVKTLLQKGNSATPEERQQVVTLIAQHGNMSEEEANAKLSAWEKSYNDVKAIGNQAGAQATEAADRTAKVVAQLSLWSFVAFVLGAIAASVGGMAGSSWRAHTLHATRVSV